MNTRQINPTRLVHGGIRLEAMTKYDIISLAKSIGVFIDDFQEKPNNAGWYGFGVLVKRVNKNKKYERD